LPVIVTSCTWPASTCAMNSLNFMGVLALLELREVPGQENDDQQRHPQHHRLERGVH
jgi:hypothetical protein